MDRRRIRVTKGTNSGDLSEPLETKPVWKLGVFALIFRDAQVLLVREKGKKEWSLPGGRLEIEDQVEAVSTGDNAFAIGISREVREETGMEVVSVEVETASPHLAKRIEDCSLGFITRANGEPHPQAEIEEVAWVLEGELRNIELVGPRMRQMISWGFRVRHLYGE